MSEVVLGHAFWWHRFAADLVMPPLGRSVEGSPHYDAPLFELGDALADDAEAHPASLFGFGVLSCPSICAGELGVVECH